MKLGVVTTSFPREPGDPAGSFVAAHVRWLEQKGHEVEVIAAADRRSEAPPASIEARAHRLSSRLFYGGGAPEALERGGLVPLAAAAGFSVRQLAAITRRLHRWDAVCAHWLAPSAAAVALVRRARRIETPFLAIAHSGDVHLLERLRLVAPVARLLDRSGARLSFSSGALARRFIEAAGPELGEPLGQRSIVCPMGVELGPPPPAARPHGGRCRLLFVGRLVPIKGIDVLLAALARLGEGFELTIAGDGPEREPLERRAAELGVADRVSLVGEVRALFRDTLLAGADVVVVPSIEIAGRTEGMPVTVLEAIAAGTPVVVSATGGLAELPVSVPKVPPGDPAALAAALLPLASRERRDRLLARQRPVAEAQSWGRVGAVLWRHWVGQTAIRRRSA